LSVGFSTHSTKGSKRRVRRATLGYRRICHTIDAVAFRLGTPRCVPALASLRELACRQALRSLDEGRRASYLTVINYNRPMDSVLMYSCARLCPCPVAAQAQRHTWQEAAGTIGRESCESERSPSASIGQAGNLMPPFRASSIRRSRNNAFSASVAVLMFTPAASYIR